MKRSCIAVLLVLSCLAPPAGAQPNDNPLETRISLNLKAAPSQQLFDLFGVVMGVEVEVDYAGEPPVTLAFDRITARTALNAFCESIDCAWELVLTDPPTLRFTEFPGTSLDRTLPDLNRAMSLELVDASAEEVFELAARVLGVELDLGFFMRDRRLSIHREGPLSQVLDGLCEQARCTWELAAGGRPVLRVRALDP